MPDEEEAKEDSRSLNATPPPIAPKPGATPDHPIFAAVEDDLRDAKWVGTHGQEEDLRSALGKTILRVEELSTLLRVAYRTTTELETNLEVAPSNLKLDQVNNNMETFLHHGRNRVSSSTALEDDEEAKRVREWRHKLQKAFLTPKAPPKSEDMPQLDALFTSVEQYDKMSIEYLSFSKIGKVMRHISTLKADNIPLNAKYNFLTRAQSAMEVDASAGAIAAAEAAE
ncbi:hypothetical protein FIBSPDRAFT_1040739 [Athelia psychrophila]|uniref:Uncharacterized protein n=1 Tax=Athelia psychrophila TaxID=1759441 RepID=A0A166PUV2_9AGAM|nr:hypothetical protein FIBSPDRAFT_1040739 [Fibularhizoctonia sp. CBS 109695]